MGLVKEEIEEFKSEALELLDQAEVSLLKIEKGEPFIQHYEIILRSFHGIKGASELMKLQDLQGLILQIKTQLNSLKTIGYVSKDQISSLLAGIDGCRRHLGESSSRSVASSGAGASEPEKKTSRTNLENKTLKPLIFVIDDEQDILDILHDILEGQNFSVKTFLQPQEALKQLKKLKPQVILTDMKMPQMSGLDLFKEVSKLEPDIPTIFISGHLDKDIILNALSHGVFGAIEKPFDDKQILIMVNNALKKYQTWKLLSKSIDFLMFQFSSLDQILQESGKDDLRQIMKNELNQILLLRRRIRGQS